MKLVLKAFSLSYLIVYFGFRGEKAFCSCECRYKEMLLEEGVDDKLDSHGVYGDGSL